MKSLIDNEPPIVPAVRNPSGHLTITCPYCGKRHTHGAFESLGSGDGHRYSHCMFRVPGADAGYIIREVPNQPEGEADNV